MHRRILAPMCALLATLMLTLAGCTAIKADAPTLFDLGGLRSAGQQEPLAGQTISVAEVRVPAWLDSQQMIYRLDYAQQQQSRPYAASRWSATPGELLTQRIRQRIAQAGAVVLSASEGARRVPMLRIQLDEFSQHFSAPDASAGRVALRATVFQGRRVIGQRTFERDAQAPSADAAGGARALAEATDAALAELITWLAGLPLQEAQR